MLSNIKISILLIFLNYIYVCYASCIKIGESFNDRLIPGQCIQNGEYIFEMQYNGNLVLYSANHICWSSGTDETDGVYVKYSGDREIDSPQMSLESPFGQLRKYKGKYTELNKTGDVSINSKGEIWIAYEKLIGC